MTLFSYEIFDAVARQGSFNKAAQQLHLTPSAISHAIAVMEEELGFALFTRGKSGVTMTSYGASLYPAIRAVLNSDEALQQSIARLNGLEKGKVRLGTFSSVCTHLLPGILQSFKAQYPDHMAKISMVATGVAMSTLPQPTINDGAANIQILPLEPAEERVVGLALPRPAAMAPAVEQMFRHIVDYCKANN